MILNFVSFVLFVEKILFLSFPLSLLLRVSARNVFFAFRQEMVDSYQFFFIVHRPVEDSKL
jgi:hypothetical protein